MFVLQAIILGTIEGITEFLPISSTGHLILIGSFLDSINKTFPTHIRNTFQIVIQSGAILAICVEYRIFLFTFLKGLLHNRVAQKFFLNLTIAFLPTGILGFLFHDVIKNLFFVPITIAITLIFGGIAILFIEKHKKNSNSTFCINKLETITPLIALKIGFAQALALIPGTSRSGATIIGGMLCGLSRRTATEFSFFLAIQTLLIAIFYSLYKEKILLTAYIPLFTIGSTAAFISAFVCIRWLLQYISTHNFTFFAWYRITLGLIILTIYTT